MHKDTQQSGGRYEGIGDEAIYLRNLNRARRAQTAAGWAVSGDTSEQSMFILYGTGANGKSTFLNVIQNILGDYAMSTWPETFMKRNNDTATNDIARLRGSRFVITGE